MKHNNDTDLFLAAEWTIWADLSKKYIEEVHDSQAALSIRSGDSMTLKKILTILVFKKLEV